MSNLSSLFAAVGVSIMAVGCRASPAIVARSRQLPPITACIKHLPLQSALAELSRISGIHLQASPDVQDLRISIFVHDIELSELRDRIAEVLHLTWEPETPEHLFRIVRSQRNIAEQKELERRWERAFRDEIEEDIKHPTASLVTQFGRDLSNRQTTWTLFPSEAAAAQLLGVLPVDLRERAYDGEEITFPSPSDPPELNSRVEALVASVAKSLPAADVAAKQILAAGGVTFTISRFGEGASSNISVGFHGPGGSGVFAIGGPGSLQYPGLYPTHTGPAYDSAANGIYITRPISGDTMDDILEQIAQKANINIVAESYLQYFKLVPGGDYYKFPMVVQPGTYTIAKAMQCAALWSTWWKTGDVYMVQRQTWWIERLAEIGDAAMNWLRKDVEIQPLTVANMIDVGRLLTRDQWQALKYISRDAYQLVDPVQRVLRFYGGLSAVRRSEVLSTHGLRASSLGIADKLRLAAWINLSLDEKARAAEYIPDGVTCYGIESKSADGGNAIRFRAIMTTIDGISTVLRDQTITDAVRKDGLKL